MKKWTIPAHTLLRTVIFFETGGYLPTRTELFSAADTCADSGVREEELTDTLEQLCSEGILREEQGRVGWADRFTDLLANVRERDLYQPRKYRKAIQVARWLARLDGVRFVALANTTSLGVARDEGDLDFFVIVRHGTIWTTRLASAGIYKVLGRLPRPAHMRDAVCLSYFISDRALDLSAHCLPGEDPYFRFWFLSLLPLWDDGVARELWNTNTSIRSRHPFARPWVASQTLQRSRLFARMPTHRWMEIAARCFQKQWFPPLIRERMNRDTTVLVSDVVLKFHVTDGRISSRENYRRLCQSRGILP